MVIILQLAFSYDYHKLQEHKLDFIIITNECKFFNISINYF